ncbi:MAG: hypothetical protein AAFP13_11000 [Pseudomonadota bacterium]
MWRIVKFLVYLLVIAGIGLTGYAYLGPIVGADFLPTRETVTVPVELDLE